MIVEALKRALGEDRVDASDGARREFSRDLTEIEPARPDVVVRAQSVEDVRLVLAAAREHRVPVIPVVANSNVGGLAVPERGGVVLEMTRMNRIVEVSDADQYAVVEPGVTWQQLREKLEKDHPTLRFGYAMSPPESSPALNCLLDGLTNLSLRYGTASDWINGVEAVLATGETVRTGSAAFVDSWCASAPMPGLTGLFVNTHGTMGVVTKVSIQLWPKRRHRRRFFISAHDVDAACEFVCRLSREEICDDIGCVNWPVARMLFGQARPMVKDEGEPELFILVDFSSNYPDELELKEKLVRRVLQTVKPADAFDDFLEVTQLVRMLPEFAKLTELPARLDFLLDHPGGGLSWIGTYGPMSKWAEGIRAGGKVMLGHGYPPAIVLRPMKGAHFGVLRLICTFDRESAAERRKVRVMNGEICDAVVPLGFVPYKTPPWILEKYRDRIDPGFRALLARTKQALDPDGILNPGKWLT